MSQLIHCRLQDATSERLLPLRPDYPSQTDHRPLNPCHALSSTVVLSPHRRFIRLNPSCLLHLSTRTKVRRNNNYSHIVGSPS